MKKLFWAALFLLPSCAGLNVYQKLSSGLVGCPPSDVRVSDENTELGVTSWTAVCRGATYYCSSTGGASDTHCKEGRH